jgi:hypothetical protein
MATDNSAEGQGRELSLHARSFPYLDAISICHCKSFIVRCEFDIVYFALEVETLEDNSAREVDEERVTIGVDCNEEAAIM